MIAPSQAPRCRRVRFGILFGLGALLVLLGPTAAVLIDSHGRDMAWITGSVLIVSGTLSLVSAVVVTLPSWKMRALGLFAIAFLVPFLTLIGAVLPFLLFVDFELPVN